MARAGATSGRGHRRRHTLAVVVALAMAGTAVGWAAPPAGATAPPQLTVDTLQIDFGSVLVGSLSPTQTVAVTNRGPGTASGLVVAAPTGSQMQLSSTNCPATLGVGSTCTAIYRYAPTVVEAADSVAEVRANGGTVAAVRLTGRPDVPNLPVRVTPLGFDYGSVAVSSAVTHTVFVYNTTGSSATVTVAASAVAAPFSISANTCAGPSVTLAAGTGCSINYRFAPTSTGAFSSAPSITVTKSGTGSRPYRLDLQGTGGPRAFPLVVSPRGLDFGPSAIGATAPNQSITVTNTSGSSVSFTAAGGGAGEFGGAGTCGGNPKVLAAGASCSLTYAPTPTRPGLLLGGSGLQLTVPGFPRYDVRYPMTAYGVGTAPRLELTTADVDLGPSPVGTPTGNRLLVLRNSGTGTLTGLSVGPPADARFTSTGTTCGSTLTAGSSCSYAVRYTPTDDARRGTTVPVSSGNGGSGQFIVRGGPVATVNGAFVTAAYFDFLRRPPSASEAALLVAALDGGSRTRRQVVTDLANSDEWIEAIVQQLYRNTLGRDGDPGGVAYWVDRIRTGRSTVAQTAANFYASPEYFSGIGGGTATSWVSDLYAKLLERVPDSAGLSYWVGQVAAKGRFSVAYRMFQSLESRRTRVTGLYEQLLQRDPDSTGLAYWADRITTQGDIALAIDLSSSTEYLQLAQTRSFEG